MFWLFAVALGLASARIERMAFPGTRLERVIRTAVLAFALIAVCGFLLGSLGWIAAMPYLLFAAACFGASVIARPRERPAVPGQPSRATPRVVLAIILPILVFVAVVGISHRPLRYDSLNYHLYFPAQWLLAHRIWIVPTPFGDEAPAYAPSNGELFFLSLMLPFHGDLLARIGQFPFYLLLGPLVYALARRAGAEPRAAIYPAAFVLLSRRIVENAVGADVDVIFVAMFLASVFLGIIASERDQRNDWIIWGVSLGLYFGVKYVALVFAPVFFLIPFIRGPRPKAVWALPGIATLALPWYLRNWIVAGSPLYPASLTIAGHTLAQGAFTHGAMTNSIFHVDDFRIFTFIASDAFGPALFLLWAPFAAFGIFTLLTRATQWTARFLALLPFAMIPLDWFGVPDNTDPRFLFPIVALALVPLAFVFRRGAVWDRWMHVLYGAGLVWLIIGVDARLRMPFANLPFYMRDGLSLHGLVASRFLPLFLVLALGAAWAREQLFRGDLLRRAAFAFSLSSAVVGAGALVACPADGCEFLDLTPTYIPSEVTDAWDWLAAHAHGETIAYTGNNIPYRLFGDGLANRVYYVNIDRHLDWKLHDYDRAHRRQQGDEGDKSALLATSSGVLRPASAEGGRPVDAVRPRFERMRGYRDAWIGNLESRGVTLLLVSRLSAYEMDNVAHDGAGFPIENEWANSDPAAFRLVYANPRVRIYTVSLAKGRA